MPKRIPTPPPGDDEPKYLTIFQPYPLNAHWELPLDRQTFARWFACCTGTSPFFAFFYKPKARGMVIVEINKEFPHFDRVLGEHRWSEFLKNPSEEEQGRVSQVFHSLYKSDREAQKDGWKRLNVEDQWFKDWTPKNPIVKHPYPATHWCPVPPEDKTNKPLCRPLPVSVHAPPARPPPPVVGSASWVGAKTGPSPSSPQVVRGAWGKPRGGPTALAISTRGSSKPTTKTTSPASALTPSSPRNKNASPNKPVPGVKNNTPVSATTSIPWGSPSSAVSSPTSSSLPTPPGLSPHPLSSTATNHPLPPGLVRNAGTDSGSSGSSLPSIASSQYNHLHEAMVGISLSPSQENQLYGLASDEPSDPALMYMAPWEQTKIEDEPLWGSPGGEGGGEEVLESLWGEEEKKTAPAVMLCKAHGVICKKGICKEYARQLREAAKKEKQAGGKGGGKTKGNNGTGSARGKSEGSWRGSNNGDRNSSKIDSDGFFLVGSGRSQAGKAGHGGEKKKAGWDEEGSGSETGNTDGRMRAYSASSRAESVAGSSNGWGNASTGPW